MSEQLKYALLAVVFASFAITTTLRGCGGYGEVSEGAYAHATALYSICNRRDPSRLDAYSLMLDEDKSAGKVSAKEAAWLEDIVSLARVGDWTTAAADARRMLADQVEETP